jgi:UDP-glucose 4-epimerase
LEYLKTQYLKGKALPVVKPGTQSRRFTHIKDTVEVCFKAWKANKCRYYSISNNKSLTILEVAKLFNSKIKYFLQEKVRDMLLPYQE